MCAASPPLEKGDLGGFKKASNPPCPTFSKGGDLKNAFLPKERNETDNAPINQSPPNPLLPENSFDFLNLISFGIASRSLSATTCCGKGGRERIEDLNFILNIFVDKKQVPILSLSSVAAPGRAAGQRNPCLASCGWTKSCPSSSRANLNLFFLYQDAIWTSMKCFIPQIP